MHEGQIFILKKSLNKLATFAKNVWMNFIEIEF